MSGLRRFLAVGLIVAAMAARADIQVKEFAQNPEGYVCWGEDISETGVALVVCHASFAIKQGDRSPRWYRWNVATDEAFEFPYRSDHSPRLRGITAAGRIIGEDDVSPFVWSEAEGFTSLSGSPTHINDLGEIIIVWEGSYFLRRADGTQLAVDGFTPVDLNNHSRVLHHTGAVWAPDEGLGIRPPPYSEGTATVVNFGAINDTGVIAATANWKGGSAAVHYLTGSGYVTLPLPVGFEERSSWTESINSLGQSVGSAWICDGTCDEEAMLWPSSGPGVALGKHLGMNTWAWRLNSSGQIIGGAYGTTGGSDRAIAWLLPQAPQTPVARIDAVTSEINFLIATAAISEEHAHGLKSSLSSAAALAGNDNPAAKKLLGAAMNQVSALVKSRRLSEANGTVLQRLIRDAMESLV